MMLPGVAKTGYLSGTCVLLCLDSTICTTGTALRALRKAMVADGMKRPKLTHAQWNKLSLFVPNTTMAMHKCSMLLCNQGTSRLLE